MPILTVEIPDELYSRLQQLATDMERTVEQCHVWALEDYIAEERELVDMNAQADADLEAGRYVTQEQMETWMSSLGTANPLPRPVPQNEPFQRAS